MEEESGVSHIFSLAQWQYGKIRLSNCSLKIFAESTAFLDVVEINNRLA